MIEVADILKAGFAQYINKINAVFSFVDPTFSCLLAPL
jgi:hypothetical protein